MNAAAPLSDFTFIKVGSALALVPLILLFSYPILRRRTRREGMVYLLVMVLIFLVGGAAVTMYAKSSGEWSLFLAGYGFGSFLEMAMILVLPTLAMLFMAWRTVQTLPLKRGGRPQQGAVPGNDLPLPGDRDREGACDATGGSTTPIDARSKPE